MQNNSDPSTPLFKVILVGDSGVGKTSFCHVCKFKSFPDNVEVTIAFDVWERRISVSKSPQKDVRVQLWDTAGQERFRFSLTSRYYRGAHAIVYIYDITNGKTFESLPHWLFEVEKSTYEQRPIVKILIGAKLDLHLNRKVAYTHAKLFAEHNDMIFYEISSKECQDEVERVIHKLASKIYDEYECDHPDKLSEHKVVIDQSGHQCRKMGCKCFKIS